MTTPEPSLARFLVQASKEQKPSAKSLLSTCFGDLGVPHGGRIWVETLTELLAPLGISDRLVRTSLFRLVEEEWLQATRAGRRSYYQLAARAERQTRLAESLIYHRSPDSWDGRWTVVLVLSKPADHDLLVQFERELAWLGFGALTRRVFIHPTTAVERLTDCLRCLDMADQLVCFSANNLAGLADGLDMDDPALASRCFNTDIIAKRYDEFVSRFAPVLEGPILTGDLSAEPSAVTLRLLLVDAYRRIVLHDPHLPDELLPQPWVGHQAYDLCKSIYQPLRTHTDKTFTDLLQQAGADWSVESTEAYDDRFTA